MVGETGPPGPAGIPGSNGAAGAASLPVGEVRAFGGSALTTDKFCHFPFYYKGQKYTRCTAQGRGTPWCFVDPHQERWANCDLHVEVEGGTAAANETCHFPFSYQGETHSQCTAKGLPDGEDGHGKMWCFTDAQSSRYGLSFSFVMLFFPFDFFSGSTHPSDPMPCPFCSLAPPSLWSAGGCPRGACVGQKLGDVARCGADGTSNVNRFM